MTNLWLIMLVAALATAFWQQRRQSEAAQHFIRQRCRQLDLQLLSTARGNHSISWSEGRLNWQTRYWFEFSANGGDCHQGYAVMAGLRLKTVYMPPHPMPEQ